MALVATYQQAKKDKLGIKVILNICGQSYLGEMFEGIRIDRASKLPKGQTVYGTRHGDSEWDIPFSISRGYPLVNFFGTFVGPKSLESILTEETDIDQYIDNFSL